ncbi:multidrug resistance-associated ABC transporter [Epithele typhae]|uniref:multidrug resistance-associated ABC transporter n=1 Tax=Epithele typhae TaxID=378194 RepID=UPI002008234E|nr:multidrug resistance-associated ABC transporter [Epithele typhae]KAH9931733.1 multidrug resistance-associated ABC transporter [Epithele typhae]
MRNPFRPPPAAPAFGRGKVIPETSAWPLSRLLFSWLDPFLAVGFSRPLEKDDFWTLPDQRLTGHLTDLIERAFYRRCRPEERPSFTPMKADAATRSPEPSSNVNTDGSEDTTEGKNRPQLTSEQPTVATQHSSNLMKALHSVFWKQWWTAGIFLLISDTLNTTTPLVNQILLTWLTNSFVYFRATDEERAAFGLETPQGIGYGIGLAFAIFVMQGALPTFSNHYQMLAMTNGICLRTSVIGAVFRKSLRLSGRARLKHNVGQITTMISTDATRLDHNSQTLHNVWVAPIQIAIGIGLLIRNIGVAGVVGVGVLLLGFPVQVILAAIMFSQRKKGVAITDQRVRATTEVFSGIRLIKYFAWESFYARQVGDLRAQEIRTVRALEISRSGLIGTVSVTPTIATILSIIIRAPLTLLPIVLAQATDASVALKRISDFLCAEELEIPYLIDEGSANAISVDGDFTWDPAPKEETKDSAVLASEDKSKSKDKVKDEILPTTAEKETQVKEEKEEKPFTLEGLRLNIPKGPEGASQSSVLQAMIGEMRKVRGECVFSSEAAYVPQTAWIMNATLRQNIVFGKEENDAQFRDIATEIGEKGINLSGGQKARVSLARAAYSGAEIVLMDDSLSAVDAYTRVLVTHSLHVLDRTDYIYVMDEGKIVEQGTYAELMANGLTFSRLIEEYGSEERQEKVVATEETTRDAAADTTDSNAPAKATDALMQDEERIKAQYFQYCGGVMIMPLILLWIILFQAATVGDTLWLSFWTGQKVPGFSQADYIGVYSSLGVASGVFQFALSMTISLAGLTGGLKIYKAAFNAVVRSPVSFFDTTPMGRIIARFSKDQDTIDQELAIYGVVLLTLISTVFGTAALVFYTFPLLGLIFIPMIIFYTLVAMYYTRSSVETKRIDSILRSGLYASYSETLTGLSSVRAYRAQDRFVRKSDQGLDEENRAYYMTLALQRWLAIRLDILGNILILGICLFAAGFRTSVDPSKIGVVLTYSLSTAIVSTYAQNEQNFNAVERVLYYIDLPSEGAPTTPDDPPPSWPEHGAVEFKDVEMAYRPGLPTVLKGVSFRAEPGEKVGIVGRTGAGKSSLMQALFRIVDGVDVATVGLDVLRERLALVPQDSLLFKGTLRENLDPMKTRTDAELIEALRRAWLLPKEGNPVDSATDAKFSLDAAVGDEGSNYSQGEKQLLALCRALVKNSQIIVLDEATSNVDVETDAKVQRTIQKEFKSSTLLCIAHRLNTIVYYDRILVMDGGRVAEFDTPLALFDREDSIFRSLCNEANLSRQDIIKIRASPGYTTAAPPGIGASTSTALVEKPATYVVDAVSDAAAASGEYTL